MNTARENASSARANAKKVPVPQRAPSFSPTFHSASSTTGVRITVSNTMTAAIGSSSSAQ